MKRLISSEQWCDIRPHLDQMLLFIIEMNYPDDQPEELLNKYYRCYLAMNGTHMADQLDWWLNENYGISYEDYVTPEEFEIALATWEEIHEIDKRRY